MQEQVASYLFQYKKCPLPGIGSLVVHSREATVLTSEQLITPPVEEIIFSDQQIDEQDFLDFISALKNISIDEAKYRLDKFLKTILQVAPDQQVLLPGVGFFENIGDQIVFSAEPTPVYFKPVHAERVIHPDRSHSMLVGDRETTTAAMNEYYADALPRKRFRWHLPAVILFVLGTAAIVLYFFTPGRNHAFGINHRSYADSAAAGYQKIER